MSAEIRWMLVVGIQPGQLDNFRSVASDLIASTQSEPGTLAYEWDLIPDETACHIYERYADSAALMAHIVGFGPFAERFLAACRPVRFDVYGNPSDEARAMIADFQPTYFSHVGGFSR